MDKNPKTLYKMLVIGIIILLIHVIVFPSIAVSNNYDNTPPVTTYALDPPEPDGECGWYVSDVNVTLNATDDMSGVKEIYYRVAESEWNVHIGDFLIFTLDHDCLEDGLIEFYAVDFAENIEEIKSFTIDIDQLAPIVDLTWEVTGGNPLDGWEITFTATAFDECSGIECVEFYFNNELQHTVEGPGPTYSWTMIYFPPMSSKILVCGLILNRNVTEEYVNFYALVVLVSKIPGPEFIFKACAYDMAGHITCDETRPSLPDIIEPGLYLFKNLTLPNNCKGYIGKFSIFATFLN